MRRCWFGAGLLGVLLVLGVVSGTFMLRHSGEMIRQTGLVQQKARQESWEEAELELARAKDRWHRHRSLSAVLSDHEPMEQVEELLVLLEEAVVRKDAETCRELALRLTKNLEALGDSHRPDLENLF